ncbi:replication factor C large subunit [Candidatus Pacearchaeota archaeon]|nr:replication factor C large subunit [Candidatus Pacearchaeota archaeon]
MVYENLAEKYRAIKYGDFIGQEKAILEIKAFLHDFPKKKGIILHGPAGTGKTSLALAAAHENNLEVFELNASDTRNKAKLEELLKPAAQQQSLFKKGKIIIMDEVDGVTGSDIGGIPELVRILEVAKHPVIMTCNDIWQSKLAPIRQMCTLVEMKVLPPASMVQLLQKITIKEEVTKDLTTLQQLAIKSQGDLRAALNDLHSYAHTDSKIDTTERRDIEENIFNILRRLFKERQDFLDLFDSTKLSLDEVLLWIEENIPREYKNEALVKAYTALSKADVFRGRIYKNQFWRFLVYQNIFQSAGISYAKPAPQSGFTPYQAPKRILKIWQHNQKIIQKKSIAKKYALYAHCSIPRALRDFEIIRHIIKQPGVQEQLKLNEDEVAFLIK